MEKPVAIWNHPQISNWILLDRRFRSTVRVGVAYGSPVERITGLLLEAGPLQNKVLIDRLLRDNGILIAFPQRDLHHDTTRPLEIRVQQRERIVTDGETNK